MFGNCSSVCGGGNQNQTYIVTTSPTNGGTPCPKLNGETFTQPCNTQLCPIDCQGAWSIFGNCSLACGGGNETQTYIITMNAGNGGRPCPKQNGEMFTQPCNTQLCPATGTAESSNLSSLYVNIIIGISVTIFLIILVMQVLRYRRNQNAKVDSFVNQLDSENLVTHQEPARKTFYYDFFISLRFSEMDISNGTPWKPIVAATQLKEVLIAQGFSVFLCAVENGDSIFDAVSSALEKCRFFVIMGSETYGKQTASMCSTFQEMHFILGKKKPFYLIKMCQAFQLVTGTQLILDVGDIMYKYWKPDLNDDVSPPQDLIDDIILTYNRKLGNIPNLPAETLL